MSEDVPDVTGSTVLPVDSYRLSFEQYERMGEAQAEQLEDCAAEFGVSMEFIGEYDYHPNYPYAWGGLFGTMSAEHASEYGYSAAPEGLWKVTGGFTIRRPDQFGPYSVELGAADEARAMLYRVVAYGPEAQRSSDASQQVEVPRNVAGERVPPGGCLQRVEDKIGVPLDAQLDLDVFDLLLLSFKHERVAQAEAEWKACMNGATGQTFESVAEASFVGTKELAIADVSCTEQSRWPDYFYAVYADYQRQMIAKEPERFEVALAAERKRFDVLTRGTTANEQ